MHNSHTRTAFLLALALSSSCLSAQPRHPRLLITTQEAETIRKNLGTAPLFDRTFAEARQMVDGALTRPMDVPIPKDAGGPTHERHKRNYTEMQAAGFLYAVTGEQRYAQFVRDMLRKYAQLYPTLGKHPAAAGESAGRLFWQTLNETVWLVHATQAYDCVYNYLTPADRALFEKNIFRPMAQFFTVDHAEEHDRIHNHGTWTTTAVGLTGFVLGDANLVEQALRGTKKDGKGGYLRQIDSLFSPDGYYTEGPYYARYALMPFFLFAQAIENNRPDLKIFRYRDGIFRKALYSALQLTSTTGAFIPINDALKEKSYLSPELTIAIDMAYAIYGADPGLLGIVKKQDAVMLSAAGLETAKGLAATPNPPGFPYASVEYRDGGDGTAGGIGLLRSGVEADQELALMKYTSHGLSHGHYDKLEILFYDQGREVLQDYGSARFLNVETKYGGRYLPENKSFAMQTIAHNTVTVDGKSQYGGKFEKAQFSHGDRHFFSSADSSLQVMSAKESGAYPGVAMQRTVAMVQDAALDKPALVDVFRVTSADEHVYDLPFYAMGQWTDINIPLTAHDVSRTVMGTSGGYQHLWNEAEGRATDLIQCTWMEGERFYTVSTAADSSTKAFFVRIGGTDPNFDLRSEPGVIVRQKAKEHVFATVLEPHGLWDGTKEFSRGAKSAVASVRVEASTEVGTAVRIGWSDGSSWIFLVANGPADASAQHSLSFSGATHSWQGNYRLLKFTNSSKE